MINAALPGTVVVLAALIILILVTVSTPIAKTFYFLSADLSGSAAGQSLSGQLTMGVFGYCLEISGGKQNCSSTSLGYSIDAASLLGFSNSRVEQAVNLDGISTSVIKGLTYVLILHPIAAAFALGAFISGLVQHIREFSDTSVTGWFSSLGTTFALIAFIFDIIVFSIAKSRINDANSQVKSTAALGNAIWMTLAAALLLMFSGCFFCCGRRLTSGRRQRQQESRWMRPQQDEGYADRMRRDAELAEKRRNDEASRRKDSNSLPAFAEFGDEETRHEAIPLKAMENDDEEQDRYTDGYGHELLQHDPARPPGAESLAGVGMGYGRRTASQHSSRHPSSTHVTSPAGTIHSSRRPFSPPQAAVGAIGVPPVPAMPPARQGSTDPYANLPAHVEPASQYMSPPPAQALEADHPLSPSSPRMQYQPSPYEDPYAAPAPHAGVGGFAIPQPVAPQPGHAYPTYEPNRQGSLPMPGAPSTEYNDAYGGGQEITSPTSTHGNHQPFDLPMSGSGSGRPASPQSYAPTYQTMPLPGSGGPTHTNHQGTGQSGWTGYGAPPSYRE